MNVFYLDTNPKKAAEYMCDKHIVKMCVESAQMLSTAHRLLDGVKTEVAGFKRPIYVMPGESVVESQGKLSIENPVCFAVAHAKHPSTIWTMKNLACYYEHVRIFRAMMDEYKTRYGKVREKLEQMYKTVFQTAPNNIPDGELIPPPLAMPDQYKGSDAVESYRRFYAGSKWKFCKWKHGNIPEWMFDKMQVVWGDELLTERIVTTADAGSRNTVPLDARLLAYARELCYANHHKLVNKNI